MTPIKLKRIYEAREESDGFRVLADRLWPRGIKKEDAAIDLWAKHVAPTNELRKWYHANMDQYDEFYKKFMLEINQNPESSQFLKTVKSKPVVTTYLLVSPVKVTTSPARTVPEPVSR